MNRNGWTYKKLGDICESELGKTLNHSTDTGNLYPYLCAINILWDKIDLSTLKETRFEESEIGRYTVNKGDLLICEGGDVGRAAIWLNDEPILYQNALHRVRFDDGFNTRFYLYYLKYLKESGIIDSRYSKGVTIKHLVKSSLLAIPVPIPKFETQTQIVSELDSLKDSVTMLQQQLTDLDELAMSIFYDMFGDPLLNPMAWPIKKIGDIGNVERGAGISKKDFVDSGLPCIHYGQLHTSFGPTAYKNITFIPSDLLPKYKIAHTGDVIMAITSEDVEGSCKSTAWLGDFDLVVGSDAAIYHHSINGVYVSYYTMTKAFYIEKEKYAKGFKVTHISAKEIESIPIPIPPMELQENFAQKVAAIEDSKATLNVQIKELQNLLAARMQYWFD